MSLRRSHYFGPIQICTSTKDLVHESCCMDPLIDFTKSPYQVGKILTLNVTGNGPSDERTVKVQILRFIQPSTLSCVMEVEVMAGNTYHAKYSILKLYDWRYSAELREDEDVGPWTSYHENEYQKFVEDGGAAAFDRALQQDDSSDDVDFWDAARHEIYLFDHCRDYHVCEVEAYSRLKDLQGKDVPRFYADVRLDILPAQNPFFEVRGILIERIQGYKLEELAEYAHQSSWQPICDEAIRIVNEIGEHEIMNEDVKPRNVLIRTHDNPSEKSGHDVVFIDFAQCKFPGLDQSQADWRKKKATENEEGAIGWVMRAELNEAIEYQPSYRFHDACSDCGEDPLKRSQCDRCSVIFSSPYHVARIRDAREAERREGAWFYKLQRGLKDLIAV